MNKRKEVKDMQKIMYYAKQLFPFTNMCENPTPLGWDG